MQRLLVNSIAIFAFLVIVALAVNQLGAASTPRPFAQPEAAPNGRYIVQERVSIRTADGATISAIVVRRRGVTGRQPTAFDFTIYADIAADVKQNEYAADRGYVAVTAYTRGKAWSPDAIVPYEFDGRDANSVISWIARQPWSNGSVGMYGGSYNGFTQWAAAKWANPALKTIVPYVANNPGNGLPMENNVFLFVNYAWIYYVSDNKFLDNGAYSDPVYQSLNEKWYASGASYRSIPKISGRPNPWFERWLQHPDFDAYWQAMVPSEKDFAKIDIPVLTVTGYYDDGQASALNYLKDHESYNSRAVDYLVIGPYDHFGSQRAHKDDVLRGYRIDPVAQFSTPKLTFDWLDYVMRGAGKPALLADRINFEVMGANTWRHVKSLDTMADSTRRFYLTTAPVGSRYYALSAAMPDKSGQLIQTVDFRDRKTTNNDYYPSPIIGKKPDMSNGFNFLSAPLEKPISINGFFTGDFKIKINKRDVDLGFVLYQVMPNGQLMELSDFLGRASYATCITARKLLTPGTVETITFDRSRLVSRELSKGSRLLLTANVNKNPFAQINYGTGKDVSDEDVRDASVPLKIEWLTGSYVDLPVSD